MIHKSDKMEVLERIHKSLSLVPNTNLPRILDELAEEGLISVSSSATLTWFGFLELQSWDPILKVSVDNRWIQPVGEA